VWKCEAPGGLHKAVKFVAPDPSQAAEAGGGRALRLEFEAFQHIKAIRHPFILQLERVELVSGELVMVMELADSQLADRFRECTTAGLAGVPRDELIGYFAEAAEALDVIGAKHGLQHLDVKPANLFLVGGHVKVGDYGLVTRLEAHTAESGPATTTRGLTPRYAAPEVLNGRIDPRSDQYSLALVYVELLTGRFPYNGRTATQLLLQHVAGTPDLSPLPESDRAVVARAMAKEPADRYPSCSAFVRALLAAAPVAAPWPPVGTRTELIRRNTVATPPPTEPTPPPPAGTTVSDAATVPDRPRPVPPTPPAPPPRAMPPAVPQSLADVIVTPAVAPTTTPPPDGAVRIEKVYAVMATDRLTGKTKERCGYVPEEYIEALMAAAAGWRVPLDPGAVAALPDGTWGCRFPTGLVPSVVRLKLAALSDGGWCHEVLHPEPHRVVLRIREGGGLWDRLARPPAGAEVVVHLPDRNRPGIAPVGAAALPGGPDPTGEVVVLGEVYGSPESKFYKRAAAGVPRLIQEVRRLLQTVDERRKSRRVAFEAPVVVYPLTPTGVILPALTGKCRDVSAGGLGCVVGGEVPSKYVYVEFCGVERIGGLAILTRVVRTAPAGNELFLAGRFRTVI
jgi:hypothetical protein